jgi:hypothetical protein
MVEDEDEIGMMVMDVHSLSVSNVIDIYGVDHTGHSIVIRVNGYFPYFYIAVPIHYQL